MSPNTEAFVPGTAEMIGRRALVVFSSEAEIPWLHLLKPGFRHCFILIPFGRGAVLYNPLSNFTELEVFPECPVDNMAAWFLEKGYRVAWAHIRQAPWRPAPWALYSCVEAVKRVLGIHARWVLTPWRLYGYLKRTESCLPGQG